MGNLELLGTSFVEGVIGQVTEAGELKFEAQQKFLRDILDLDISDKGFLFFFSIITLSSFSVKSTSVLGFIPSFSRIFLGITTWPF